jgi:hypothetical protein
MAKVHTTISIEPELAEQAKQHGFNISELTERAITHKLNPENDIDKKGDRCEYCGIEMRQATANDMNGLYWFLPDEKWICPSCENEFTRKIIQNKDLVSTSTDKHIKEIKELAREFVWAFRKDILEQVKTKEPFVN